MSSWCAQGTRPVRSLQWACWCKAVPAFSVLSSVHVGPLHFLLKWPQLYHLYVRWLGTHLKFDMVPLKGYLLCIHILPHPISARPHRFWLVNSGYCWWRGLSVVWVILQRRPTAQTHKRTCKKPTQTDTSIISQTLPQLTWHCAGNQLAPIPQHTCRAHAALRPMLSSLVHLSGLNASISSGEWLLSVTVVVLL